MRTAVKKQFTHDTLNGKLLKWILMQGVCSYLLLEYVMYGDI